MRRTIKRCRFLRHGQRSGTTSNLWELRMRSFAARRYEQCELHLPGRSDALHWYRGKSRAPLGKAKVQSAKTLVPSRQDLNQAIKDRCAGAVHIGGCRNSQPARAPIVGLLQGLTSPPRMRLRRFRESPNVHGHWFAERGPLRTPRAHARYLFPRQTWA